MVTCLTYAYTWKTSSFLISISSLVLLIVLSDPSSKLFGGLDDACLILFIVALRPKSTALVIAGRSVHLTTLFPGQA